MGLKRVGGGRENTIRAHCIKFLKKIFIFHNIHLLILYNDIFSYINIIYLKQYTFVFFFKKTIPEQGW